MAAAHGERHEYREASALVEKGLRAGPGVTWAYRMLASFYAQAGEVEKATAALAEFKRHNTGITIEKLRQGMPDRQCVVSGRSVLVRGSLSGRRIQQKKTKKQKQT